MKKRILPILMLLGLTLVPGEMVGQRQQQALGRGVVVSKNGTAATVTWRRLAQEPENATYNIYVNGTKLNSSPVTNTNFASTAAKFPVGSEVEVKIVVDGVEKSVGVPYKVTSFDLQNMFMNIRFDDSPLTASEYGTSYVWPVDLDGDGEMDYVVDRKKDNEDMIEAYTRYGEHLWTVSLGPNIHIARGHSDMVLAYDMDCDGKGDVVVKTSDGTRFWDKANKTFGDYLMGKEDTDGDGIINYETQSVKNPPQYITVVDGLTGTEKATVEMPFPSDGSNTYSRNNKSAYRGDDNYSQLQGHMGVCYLDGVHPSVGMEYMCRTTDGTHHYYVSAWGYDFSSGNAGEWEEKFTWSRNDKRPWPAEFHHIRVADVDGDGRDEILSGGYGVNYKGEMEFSAGISHGDRFRVSDIDPERPGLETFAIQQNAPDMLGQILYDAGTGEAIKKWYLSAVGDVGRGECMDVDPNYLGWEMWSTMGGVYDAKGELIPEHTAPFPTEGIWWDGKLDREVVRTSDSHYNVYIQDFMTGGRFVEFAKLSGWRYTTVYAARAAFWGDIIGDWREEIVLLNREDGVCVGIVGFTTDITTDINNIYCLQEDPAYRMQCTTKGYYQSPNTGFYLGYDMPRPQLPPVMVADDENDVFGISLGDATITPRSGMKNIYAMPVKGQTLTLASLDGSADLWKSQQGTLVLNGDNTSTGKTYISEGTLAVNGEVKGDIDLRARGTLAGSAVVNNITFEGALNYEGCRIAPSKQITFKQGLTIDKKVYMEMDITAADGTPSADLIKVEGNLAITSPAVFTIVPAEEEVVPGKYKLIEYTGELGGDIANISVRGLTGLSYNIVNEDNAIYLVVNAQREASLGVKWTGAVDGVWNYQTENFILDDVATEFVAEDAVEFNDDATTATVTVDELMPVSKITVDNSSKAYTFNGDGGFSGTGMLVKNGTGKLTLNTTKSDYTGATVINGGTVVVKDLADGGMPSSLGAAASSAANLKIGQATLQINNSNTSTNRGITLTDTATILVSSGATSLKGIIKGAGMLVKKGSGQLNITYGGNNTWSGGTQLYAGTLAMGAWNTTFGTSTSKIEVLGNSTIRVFDQNSTSAVPTINNTIDVLKGKTLTIATGQRCAIKGKLTGAGNVKISFPYVRGDVYTNMSAFEGVFESTSGQLRFASAFDLSKGTLKLGAGVYAAHVKGGSGTEQVLTSKIGSLVSTATDCTLASGNWNVGYLGEDGTYAGTFNSAATINKYGDGILTLTGASAGKVNVNAGAVYLNNTTSTTTGVVTANSGGLVAGTGTSASVTVNNGGIVGAGKSTYTIGTLTLTGNLNVKSGGIVRVRARGTTTVRNDKFDVAGKVALTSPVFKIEHLNGEFKEGDELEVFVGDGTVTLTGEPTFEPAVPLAGYLWDYSTLTTDGTIRVIADPVGIDGIEADANGEQEVYDLSGRKLRNADGKGVYIINGKKVAR